jgi:hypothetical protein
MGTCIFLIDGSIDQGETTRYWDGPPLEVPSRDIIPHARHTPLAPCQGFLNLQRRAMRISPIIP